MSRTDPAQSDDGAGEIAPGRRLIRADDAGAGIAGRIARKLHHLVWRTPFHALQLRGRYPLKLLAVPKDPVAGDRAAGEAILAGSIDWCGQSAPLQSLDFLDAGQAPDFADHLSSFAWLRDLAAAAGRERGARVAEAAVRRWLDQCATQVDERAWRADLWGRRILFWTAYAPYLLSSSDVVYRSQVLNTLARGARHLDRVAEKAQPGLPRITAWAGVIVAALVVQGGPARLGRGEAGFERALGSGMNDDGGLLSRSPLEQLAFVELLAQVRAAYLAARRDLPDLIAETMAGAVGALLSVTLGDEALSSWQGGNMLSRRRIAAVVEGTGLAPRPLRQARGWGYQRLAARKSVCIVDAAPPPPSRITTAGCASTLALEFSDGADRILVNCGGIGAAAGALPPALVKGLRTTAAHSTLTLGDRNSTAILDDGTLGKGVAQVELARDDAGGIAALQASHDGYVRRYGLAHQRGVTLSADGLELNGEDVLVPQGKKRRTEPVPFAARFHLAPNVEVTSTADGQGALLRIKGSTVWQFRCRGGALCIEDSLWVDGDAAAHATLQLIVTGEVPPDGHTLSWMLKRAK